MDKLYLELNKKVPALERERKERVGQKRSARRIFSGAERRFLSLEARSMAYGLLDSQSIHPDITENAVQQAVALGSLSGEEIDVQTFEVLFQAVTLNPSFKIPVWFVPMPDESGAWIS